MKLPRDVVAGLGEDYIVLLTNRLPGGFPYFVPHWKLAPDGFDITPVDTTVTATTPRAMASTGPTLSTGSSSRSEMP